ncbi:hypothetical protein CPB85DRAFT_1441630 [Mucidula mucida]|nr:hypothetical protein CPB85DRAFT_1441630 [Mucidula mucida]
MHLVSRIDHIIAGRAVSPKTTLPAPPSGEATPAPARSSSPPVLKLVYPRLEDGAAAAWPKVAKQPFTMPAPFAKVCVFPPALSDVTHIFAAGFQQCARPSPVNPDREIFNWIPTPHDCTEFLKWEAQIAEANKAKRSMQELARRSEVAPSQSSAGVLPILKWGDCQTAEEVYWIVLHGTKPGIFHGRLECLSANPTSTPAAWAFTMGEAAIIFTKNYMDGVVHKSG